MESCEGKNKFEKKHVLIYSALAMVSLDLPHSAMRQGH